MKRNPHRPSPSNSRGDDISDSNNDGDDEMAIDEIDDVTDLAETRPLHCTQRRMSSPIIEYGARRESLVHHNSGNVYIPKTGNLKLTFAENNL